MNYLEMKKNQSTELTLETIVNSPFSPLKENFYHNCKVNDKVYSITKENIEENIDDLTTKFKPSKNGLWLVPSKTTGKFNHNRDME